MTKIQNLKAVLQPFESIVTLKKETQTEKSGPCPICREGEDRFRLNTITGRAWCRQCGWKGDIIDYHSHVEGVNISGLMAKYFSSGQPMRDTNSPIAINHKISSTNQPEKEKKNTVKGKFAGRWVYLDENGKPAYTLTRFDNTDGSKDCPIKFIQDRFKGKGKRIPYNLPAIIKNNIVYIVEGEKCAEVMILQGLPATTNPGGAGHWQPELNQWFSGKRIVILPDNDEPGRKHKEMIIRNLSGIAAEIKVVNLPGLAEKGDIVDWIASGGTKDELLRLV